MAPNTARSNDSAAPSITTPPVAIHQTATAKHNQWLPNWHTTHASSEAANTVPTTEDSKPAMTHRRSSITERIAELLPHHDGHKRPSISDSGPLVVEEDPKTGHPLAHVNRHWPEEDSWRRQKERDGSGEDPVVAPAGVGNVSSY
ncbi:hypothetical protein LTR15_011025 [Elasticomyces elasticus]|nr:hypothetical protein LTR15_011025 [Elasticomyces elasticus]